MAQGLKKGATLQGGRYRIEAVLGQNAQFNLGIMLETMLPAKTEGR